MSVKGENVMTLKEYFSEKIIITIPSMRYYSIKLLEKIITNLKNETK